MREFLIFCLRKLGLWLREGANFGLILSFVLGFPCSSGKEGRREGKRKLVWKVSRKARYETYMYGNYMYEIIVWKSLFVYVWVRKTLTHNKGAFGWFKFNFEG